MNRRTFLIIGVLVLIAVIGAVIYFSWLSRNTGPSQSSVSISTQAPPIGNSKPVSLPQAFPNAPTEDTIAIGTPSGIVRVKNFYNNGASQPLEGGGVLIKMTPTYWFSYDTFSSSFWIAVYGSPFAGVQAAAEQDFLNTLGIDQASACKLSVSIGVPYSPTDDLSGRSFPLSFCAGSFPQ